MHRAGSHENSFICCSHGRFAIFSRYWQQIVSLNLPVVFG